MEIGGVRTSNEGIGQQNVQEVLVQASHFCPWTQQVAKSRKSGSQLFIPCTECLSIPPGGFRGCRPSACPKSLAELPRSQEAPGESVNALPSGAGKLRGKRVPEEPPPWETGSGRTTPLGLRTSVAKSAPLLKVTNF